MTYGAPFRKLDKLARGDRVEVKMPYGTFIYRVEERRIVAPTAIWVTRRTSYDRVIPARPATPVFGGEADRRVRPPRRLPAQGQPPCLSGRSADRATTP